MPLNTSPTSIDNKLISLSEIKNELFESENRFEMAFKHSAIGMSLVDPDGKFLKVNNAFCNLLGYTKEEMLQKNFIDLTYHKDLHSNLKQFEMLKQKESQSFTITKRYIHKDGSLIWVSVTVSAIRNSNDKLLYSVTQVLDISKRIEYEKKIKDQMLALQKFKKAVDSTSDHIVITDTDGLVLYANDAVQEITGFAKSEILNTKAGKVWGGLMPKEFYAKMWKTIKVDQKTFEGRIKNKRKDESIYYAELKISPIFDEDGLLQFFVGIERDITKEVEIDQMKTDFISLASHQLKTPVASVSWFSEMLLDKQIGSLSERQLNCVHNIVLSNRRMLGIVNDLLNISKIEAGKLSLVIVPVNVKTDLEDIVKELELEISKKNLSVNINVSDSIQTLNTDLNAFNNIVSNLISNAIKYTPENGQIFVDVKEKGESVLVRIRDTGIGISEEDKPKIFHKFYRSPNAIDKNPEGTGLGLYIFKILVGYLGGEVGYDSEKEKGSTFWFTIPKATHTRKGEFEVD